MPKFNNKQELFTWLRTNKSALIAEKKYNVKRADATCYLLGQINQKEHADKSDNPNNNQDYSKIKAELIINTTNLMDSHSDVHIPGLWNKSLKELKTVYLLQEHEMSFKGIISDDNKASVKTMTWNDLGFPEYKGLTQALVFNSNIDKERNPYMFEQYLKGRVKNHSVGMQYVKLDLAINSDYRDDAEEKAVWDKYFLQIVNQDKALDQGYFWAVTEAKIIEGSAVPVGSNYVTPTYSMNVKEPSLDTHENKEPVKTTPVDYNYLTQKLKLTI